MSGRQKSQWVDPGHRPERYVEEQSPDHNTGLQRLLRTVGGRHLLSVQEEQRNVTEVTIHLATMQRMYMHRLQSEIVDLANEIVISNAATDAKMDEAGNVLNKYVNALKDYDFMVQQKSRSAREKRSDLFEISTNTYLGRELIKPMIKERRQRMTSTGELLKFDSGFNILPGVSRGELNDEERYRLIVERLAMGLIGGLALIGPMLLMVLHKDLLTTLLTTATMTTLFAMGLALFSELSGEAVLGAVATYAAVLVVFVGATS